MSTLNLKRVINASGKMSIIGVSTLDPEVIEAISYGASNFFEMSELQKEAGKHVADLFGFENAYIVSSASAGIAQSVAAAICQDQADLYLDPYTETCEKREIVIPKGQNVDFGAPVSTMIQVGGGIVREAGYANTCRIEDVKACINENTAALLFVKSHHAVQKSMIELKEMVAIAKEYKLPLIVDAAAEENIVQYNQYEIDFLILSGAKAFEGPSSGIVFGTNQSMRWIRNQASGLGRAMKIGKENIHGLVKAVERYIVAEFETKNEQLEKLNPFVEALNSLKGITAEIVQDESGREIYRARIHHQEMPILVEKLKTGNPTIYTREYNKNIGSIDLDIRALKDEDYQEIINKLKEVL